MRRANCEMWNEGGRRICSQDGDQVAHLIGDEGRNEGRNGRGGCDRGVFAADVRSDSRMCTYREQYVRGLILPPALTFWSVGRRLMERNGES